MEVKDSSFTSFSSSPTPASLKTAIRSSTWRLSPISRCWKLWFNWTMLISVKKNTHCYSAFSFLTSHSQTLNALPEEKWMLSFWKIFLVPLPGFLSFLVFHRRERCHFPFSSDLITAEKSHRQRYTCTRKTSGFLVSTLLRVFLRWSCNSCKQERFGDIGMLRHRALRALGLLLADGALTVGWGKTFWWVGPSQKRA